jgi:hypothetical protein
VGLKSDPGRLPRRNHYQEGPGFLFVATQGGRPAASTAERSAADAARARMRALRAWSDGGSVPDACVVGACSRATLFRWRDRFDAGGLAGLLDRPRTGDCSALAPEPERAILLVRMLSYWNSRRIAAEFGRRGVTVSHGQIDRLLARTGTNRTSAPRVPGPRYERTSANELWHIDLKGPFFLPTPTGAGGAATSSPWSTTSAGSCSASVPSRARRPCRSSRPSPRRSSCAASRRS